MSDTSLLEYYSFAAAAARSAPKSDSEEEDEICGTCFRHFEECATCECPNDAKCLKLCEEENGGRCPYYTYEDEEMIKIFKLGAHTHGLIARCVSEENKQLKAENKKLKDELEEVKDELEVGRGIHEDLTGELRWWGGTFIGRDQVEKLKAENKKLKDDYHQKGIDEQGAIEDAEKAEEQVEELTSNTEELFKENQEQESDMDHLQEENENLKEENKKLKEENEMLKEENETLLPGIEEENHYLISDFTNLQEKLHDVREYLLRVSDPSPTPTSDIVIVFDKIMSF